MQYMKEILRNNRNWLIAYLLIGLFNAFMSNYKADYFQKIIDGLTDQTITVYGILFHGIVLFVNYGMNYLDEYPAAKLGNEIYLDFKLLALRKIGKMDYSEYQKLGTGKLVQQFQKPIFMYALKKHNYCQCLQHWIMVWKQESVKKELVYRVEKSSGWH